MTKIGRRAERFK